MQPIRKPFFGDPLFPFEIAHRIKKSPQRELPDHLHDRYELIYVYEGRGTILIDNTFYSEQHGDFFLVPGNTIHRTAPDADDPLCSTALYFPPAFGQSEAGDGGYASLFCFDWARKRKSYKLTLPSDLRGRVEAILAEIAAECDGRQLGYRESVRLHLRRLLLQINRHIAADLRVAPSDARIGPPWITASLRAIDDHPERSHALRELARRAAVTPAHFARVFKQLTGMNTSDYVNAKRVIRAKELLAETEDGISRVAERCGFHSLPHFHRVFKSVTGVTPGAYQREQRQL